MLLANQSPKCIGIQRNRSMSVIEHHGVEPQSPGMLMKTAHICAFFLAHTTRGHIYNLVLHNINNIIVKALFSFMPHCMESWKSDEL